MKKEDHLKRGPWKEKPWNLELDFLKNQLKNWSTESSRRLDRTIQRTSGTVVGAGGGTVGDESGGGVEGELPDLAGVVVRGEETAVGGGVGGAPGVSGDAAVAAQ